MKTVLLILFVLSLNAIFGQKLYFPTIGDGTQNPKAEFGYLDGVPLEINTDSIVKLSCNQGRIEPVKDQAYNYLIYPQKTGLLRLTLTCVDKGIEETITANIEIVSRPILKLVVQQNQDSLNVDLADSNGTIVTKDFSCAMQITISINDEKRTYMVTDWKRGIEYKTLFEPDKVINSNRIVIHLRTTAVYSLKYDLYTGTYEHVFEINEIKESE